MRTNVTEEKITKIEHTKLNKFENNGYFLITPLIFSRAENNYEYGESSFM